MTLSPSRKQPDAECSLSTMSHEHDHTDPPSDLELRVKALESLLLEKGLVKQDALNAIIETYEHKVGPKNGAHVVAKAWSDLPFKTGLAEGRDRDGR